MAMITGKVQLFEDQDDSKKRVVGQVLVRKLASGYVNLDGKKVTKKTINKSELIENIKKKKPAA